jgi:hypothetical protein
MEDTMSTTTDFLRSCAWCAAWLVGGDSTSELVYCERCRPKHVTPVAEWVVGIKVGDRVYVQPYAAWRGLSREPYLVTARDGSRVTVQLIGVPEGQQVLHVNDLGQHQLAPRRTVAP